MRASSLEVARLPAAMLARLGPLPTTGAWFFEVKWDGFRCLVDTHDGLRVMSRRRWNMTARDTG
jgi:ATP-dependent DNA ligase